MEFSKEQNEAITHGTGPMLVLAGPGSGKTAVIIRRVRYLTEELQIPEENILVITFTKAAAEEMEQRYQRLTGCTGQSKVCFSTFHALFFKILRESAGYTAGSLLKESEKYAILRDVLYKLYPKRMFETEMLQRILGEISRYKSLGSEDTEQHSLMRKVQAWKEACAAGKMPWKNFGAEQAFLTSEKNSTEGSADRDAFHTGKYGGKCDKNAVSLTYVSAIDKELFAAVYPEYERRVRAEQRLDFDDMIRLCCQLLQEDKGVLRKWQERFRYILVDEYQDIDPQQYEAVKLLAGTEANLFVVGDDDQSIYAFRGAAPQLVRQFKKDFPKAGCTVLACNYRSHVNVTRAAARLIRENTQREEKRFTNHTTEKGVFRVEKYMDRAEEYKLLAEQIAESRIPLREQAVLYRTNRQPGGLLMQLRKKNIPYRMQGRTNDLWEHWMTQDIAAYFRLARGARERKEFLRIANRPVRYLPRNLFQDTRIEQERLMKSLIGRYDLQDIVRKLFFDIGMLQRMNSYAAMHYIRKAIGYEEFLVKYAWEQGIEKEELFDVLEEIADTTRAADSFEEWEQQMLQMHALTERNGGAGRRRVVGMPETSDETLKERMVLTENMGNGLCNEVGMVKGRAERNGEPDCLNLMTFHASKGLEFRRVYLIDLNEGLVPHRRAKTKEEIEEERRVLYVAMTRAKEELYLLYTEKRGGRDIPPSRFLRELI